MFSVNSVTFAFCKLFFCHDSLQNFAGTDAFKCFLYQVPNTEYSIRLFAHSSCYELISEHFGENHMILLQMVAT